MNFKNTLAAVAAFGAATLAVAAPTVSDVRMIQPTGSRNVTIKYKLTEDAVVTLEVFTNAVPYAADGWASIGGEAVCNAQGAVWRKVTSTDVDGSGDYTIVWRPIDTWKDEEGNCLNVEDGCAKAVVTAWALDNPPDYMVVDISTGAAQNTQRYYPAVDFLPGAEPGQRGAITNNPIYKTSSLVMRKIMAKDITWTMGSSTTEPLRPSSGRENSHHVTLSDNYYIAVFETTQAQWGLIQTARPTPSYFNDTAWRDYRPVEQVCYNEIRMQANNTGAAVGSEEWPGRPYPGSFLALLSDRTGIDFDLPTEAQWEFACRAGHGSPYWGDGSNIWGMHNDGNLNLLGRYALNGGWIGGESDQNLNSATAPAAGCDSSHGTAWVGSYAPNSWGLYDMHGNVCEWCIDWFYDGGLSSSDGTPVDGDQGKGRSIRGGSFGGVSKADDAKNYFGRADHCRSAYRQYRGPAARDCFIGFRVVCPADFQ